MRFGGIPFGFGGGGGGGFEDFFGGARARQPRGPKTFKCYETLEVAKTATAKEIRRAYLNKSRKGPSAHPDRGGDPKKFQELQQAYETLKNKKEEYDEHGDAMLAPDWEQRGGGSSKRPERKAPTIAMKLTVTLADLYNGAQKKVPMVREVFINESTREVCPGDGSDICSTCSTCGGQGAVLRRHSPQPGYIVQQQVRCPKCRGRGYDLVDGWVLGKKEETLDVFIEKGSKNGEKIKFRDKGNMQPGFTTGDFCVVLNQVKHPFFKRKGADLLMQKEMSLVDALCGFNFEIEHLDGRKIIVESKPGEVIRDESVMVLKGEGFPVKGDAGANGHLFLEFTLDFPKNNALSSTQQNELYRVITGRQRSMPRAIAAKRALKRLGSGERAIEAAHRQKLQAFKLKLEAWRDNKIKRYDTDSSVRADRNKKYHDRSGYTAFLIKTIGEKLDKERNKMQSKLAFDADLSTSPRSGKIHAGASAADDHDDEDSDEEEAHYLDGVTSELFGQKTNEMRRGAQDESDSDEERRGGGGGAQQCHVQ